MASNDLKQTDLQQAAENVNPSELSDNLNQAAQAKSTQPQDLDQQQTTPFIDESLRTDK